MQRTTTRLPNLVVPLPSTPVAEATAVPISAPGMPAAGGVDMTWLLTAAGIALATLALAIGLAARRAAP